MKHLTVDIQLNYENLEIFRFFRTNFFEIFDNTVFISFFYRCSTYDIEVSFKLVYELFFEQFLFQIFISVLLIAN